MIEQVVVSGGDFRLENANEKECELAHEMLSGMDFYKSYDFVVITETMKVLKDDRISFLVLLNFNYTVKPVKYPLHAFSENYAEMIGIVRLTKDYGRVFIRPETIEDKITELFSRIEIDFENETQFNRKYYTVADHEERLRTQVTSHFLRTIAKFDDLEIEINGHNLFVRTRHPYAPEVARILAEFLAEINNGSN
jgi:hypothetical protein